MHVKFPPGYNHCSSASDAPTHPVTSNNTWAVAHFNIHSCPQTPPSAAASSELHSHKPILYTTVQTNSAGY